MDTFRGRAKKLDDIDLPKLGALLGVGEDELHAFIDVETHGSGFDSEGRPRILFERHKFYKYVSATKRPEAVKQGLANAAPGGYGKESDQYPKLLRAIELDRKAALLSCSWGLAQIMGFNYGLAGYASVESMVTAFMDDEENHLAAAVAFIKATGLDDELRAHNWPGFAKGYNGENYKINKYDTKLASAFTKWSRIKDTPWPVVPTPAPTVVIPVIPATPEATSPPTPIPAEPAIIIGHPVADNPPAVPSGPSGKKGWTVVASIVAALGAAIVRYFGG